MIRKVRVLGALAALSIAVAACGGGSDTDGTSSPSDGSTDASASNGGSTASTAAGDSTPGDPESGGGDPLVVGVTSAQVPDVLDWEQGVRLAVEEINAAGGVLGRQIEVKAVDTDNTSPEGITAGFQALADAKVDAILSPYVLAPQAGMDVAAAYGAPYLHGNTQQLSLDLFAGNKELYKNAFQMDSAESWYGSGLIPFANSLRDSGKWTPKNNKIYVVQTDIEYNRIINEALQKAIADSGGEWESAGTNEISSAEVADWSPILQEIKAADPGFVVIDDFRPDAEAAFAKAWAADPVDGALVYLQYGPSQTSFLELAGDAAEGMVWGTVWGVPADEKGQEFRDKYIAKYGAPMGLVYSVGGYDTMMVLKNAWEAAGTADFDPTIEALRKTEYRGAAGFYSFDENQAGTVYPDQTDDTEKALPHLFFQVQGGEHKVVGPENLIESEFQTPPWWGS